MEEAWELAVVSAGDATEEKIKGEWIWSPKHTRLRYQLFLLSLTVFVLGSFELQKFALPFQVAEFRQGDGPEQDHVLILFVVIYLATLVDFILTSVTENRIGNRKLLHLGDYKSKLAKLIEGFVMDLKEYSGIAQRHEQSAANLSMYAGEITSAVDRINAFWDMYESSLNKEELRDLLQMIFEFNRASSEFGNALSPHPIEFDDLYKNYGKPLASLAFELNARMKNFPLLKMDLEILQDSVKSLDWAKTDIEKAKIDFNRGVVDYTDEIRRLQSAVDQLSVSQLQEIGEVGRQLDGKLSQLLIESQKRTKLFTLQRAFEAWVPGFASAIIAGLGLKSYFGILL